MLGRTKVPLIFSIHILMPLQPIYESIKQKSYYLVDFKMYISDIMHVKVSL